MLASEVGSNCGRRVTVCGWVHALRKMGQVSFLIIRDRSGLIQAVVSSEEVQPLNGLQVETVVRVDGDVVSAPALAGGGGHELQNVRIEVISPVTEPPPLTINKKDIKANLPSILDHAVIAHRHPRQQAIMRLASGTMQGFRRVLTGMDFVEIQTPKILGTATESGADVFGVDYFGRKAFLAQSPQFYKQIMVGVLERVFEIGPVFRAEKHDTIRHLAEYVSMDVEMGFIENHFTVMETLTEVMYGILDHLNTEYAKELGLLEVTLPFIGDMIPRLHMTDAQQLLTDRFGVKDAQGEPDLTPEHERLLGQWAKSEHNADFLFVTGYPMVKRPFYTHPDHSRPEYSNSFDLLFRGQELVTGGQRLHRYEDYQEAARHRGYDEELFTTYFETFKHGMPPHGGFAIGLERFLMQLLRVDNIRLVTLFPRDINRVAP